MNVPLKFGSVQAPTEPCTYRGTDGQGRMRSGSVLLVRSLTMGLCTMYSLKVPITLETWSYALRSGVVQWTPYVTPRRSGSVLTGYDTDRGSTVYGVHRMGLEGPWVSMGPRVTPSPVVVNGRSPSFSLSVPLWPMTDPEVLRPSSVGSK